MKVYKIASVLEGKKTKLYKDFIYFEYSNFLGL